MALPTVPTNQPLGLQRLSELDSLEVHSKRIWNASEYEFRERSGQLLFSTHADPEGFCSSGMRLNLTLFDLNEEQVIKLQKPRGFCISKVEIRVQDVLVSMVKQRCTCHRLLLEVTDANEVPVFRFRGPWLQIGSFTYPLTNMEEQPLGSITKNWGGWRKELTTRRDNFFVDFPRDLDVKYKVACIGACVYIIHERRRRRQNR